MLNGSYLEGITEVPVFIPVTHPGDLTIRLTYHFLPREIPPFGLQEVFDVDFIQFKVRYGVPGFGTLDSYRSAMKRIELRSPLNAISRSVVVPVEVGDFLTFSGGDRRTSEGVVYRITRLPTVGSLYTDAEQTTVIDYVPYDVEDEKGMVYYVPSPLTVGSNITSVEFIVQGVGSIYSSPGTITISVSGTIDDRVPFTLSLTPSTIRTVYASEETSVGVPTVVNFEDRSPQNAIYSVAIMTSDNCRMTIGTASALRGSATSVVGTGNISSYTSFNAPYAFVRSTFAGAVKVFPFKVGTCTLMISIYDNLTGDAIQVSNTLMVVGENVFTAMCLA